MKVTHEKVMIGDLVRYSMGKYWAKDYRGKEAIVDIDVYLNIFKHEEKLVYEYIPISLDKCLIAGFVKIDEKTYFYKLKHDTAIYLKIINNKINVFLNDFDLSLTYFHQLQQLFRAITGTELTIVI